MFLDACHSGAIGTASARGPEAEYDPRELGEGEGRYFIASCAAGQKSYEDEGNGIFTKYLLQILKGENEEIKAEEIDTSTLIPVLRKKVKEVAADKYKAVQELTERVDFGRSIVLAINPRARQARIDKDERSKAAELELFTVIRPRIEKTDAKTGTMLSFRLRRYLSTRHRDSGYEDLYKYYDQVLILWLDGRSQLDEWVSYLIEIHDGILNAPPPPPPQDKSVPDALKAGDKFVTPAEANTVSTVKNVRPVLQEGSKEEQRQLSQEHQDKILEDIIGEIDYYNEAKPLIDILSRPVSRKAFAKAVHETRSKKKDDATLGGILDAMVPRFMECWDQSQVVASATVSNVRFR